MHVDVVTEKKTTISTFQTQNLTVTVENIKKQSDKVPKLQTKIEWRF